MKIFLGSDHNGFDLKQTIFAHLSKLNYDVEDLGNTSFNPDDDFPQYAFAVATKVLGEPEGEGRGILLCGSGQGVCIAANRVNGIRGVLVWDKASAQASRNDDDGNVLCLPARWLEEIEALEIVDTWLTTPFAQTERFQRRLKQIEEL